MPNPLIPNDCAVVSVCAATVLSSCGVKNKIIRISSRHADSHVFCVFEHNGTLIAYDQDGSMRLKNAKLSSTPLEIAKAYVAAWGLEEMYPNPAGCIYC